MATLVRAAGAVVAAAALALTLTACGVLTELVDAAGVPVPSVTAPADQPAPAAQASRETATLVAVVDGDTITTDVGRVRIIGIDTPERGVCGHDEASHLLSDLLVAGEQLALELPPGQNAEDRYGRLLRHVFTADGVDVALRQLEAGLAVARYDSTDGYPEHPYEREYHAAQAAADDADLGPCGQTDG